MGAPSDLDPPQPIPFSGQGKPMQASRVRVGWMEFTIPNRVVLALMRERRGRGNNESTKRQSVL